MTFGPFVAPFFARSEEVQFHLVYACKIERSEGELKTFSSEGVANALRFLLSHVVVFAVRLMPP